MDWNDAGVAIVGQRFEPSEEEETIGEDGERVCGRGCGSPSQQGKFT